MAALLGALLGVLTGLPIGVVNVAIVDAATRGELRFATGIGLGGALADAVHAGLAFAGIGHLVASHSRWSTALTIAAAVVIVIYVIVRVSTRNAAPARSPDVPGPSRSAHTTHAPGRTRGFATGVVLTLPNPAALAAWVAVAAAIWPAIDLGPGIALGAGVGLGSALWFTLLARWIATLPKRGRLARIIPKLAGVLLAGLAVLGVVRAIAAV